MQNKTRPYHPCINDQGFVMVMGLMFMVVLSIMAAAAMIGRNTEQQIVTNSEVSDHNFYTAEAVAIEGLVNVHHGDDLTLNNPGVPPFLWLQPEAATADIGLSANWPNGPMVPQQTTLTGPFTNVLPSGYASDGTAAGDRIWFAGLDKDCGSTYTHNSIKETTGGVDEIGKCYELFGMYDVKSGAGKAYHGRRMVSMGYNKTLYIPK